MTYTFALELWCHTYTPTHTHTTHTHTTHTHTTHHTYTHHTYAYHTHIHSHTIYTHANTPLTPHIAHHSSHTTHHSDDIVTLVLAKPDAISEWRELIGPTNSNRAREEAPESLRARYGHDQTRNALHGSDNYHSSEREIKFMFPECM